MFGRRRHIRKRRKLRYPRRHVPGERRPAIVRAGPRALAAHRPEALGHRAPSPSRRRPRIVDKGRRRGTPTTVEQRKRRLVQLCARTDRGKSASPEVAAEIESIVAALEAVNPTKDPAVNKELITGKWSLLYTGASAEDAAKRAELEGAIGSALTEVSGSSGNVAKKRTTTTTTKTTDPPPRGRRRRRRRRIGHEEEKGGDAKPMGRTISTFSGDAVDNGGNFQDIDAFKGEVLNRAELAIFRVPLEVEIVASCEPADPRATTESRGGWRWRSKVRLTLAGRCRRQYRWGG